MPYVPPLVEHEAVDYLVKKLDHRMGAALFVGASLSEVAMHVARRGLSLTIVEADKARVDRFLAPVREAKLDRTVNVDSRPYEDIEFLEELEEQKDIEEAKKALKEAARKGTISLARLKKELAL